MKKFIIILFLFLILPSWSMAQTAQVWKTGQSTCYDSGGAVISCGGSGQDGDTKSGVSWPSPRFTDNGDGTITDNLTGLAWLKDANCMASNYTSYDSDGAVSWQGALNFVAGINAGTYSNCGAGKIGWRLPNRKELLSLVDYNNYNPSLPTGNPFTTVQNGRYWSATSQLNATNSSTSAWYVDISEGEFNGGAKSGPGYVWPVRSVGSSGNSVNLTVAKSGPGSGKITTSPGTLTWSGNTGVGKYTPGTSVTLTASANSGSTFTGWSGNGCSGTGACFVTMDSAMNVTATFTLTQSIGQVAQVWRTGQGACYDSGGAVISCGGSGQDGDSKSGASWPSPRFTDNGDGTITDNLTGLAWLKDANCMEANYPAYDADGAVSWQGALDFVAGINGGSYSKCGAGKADWRLPNRKELLSLVDYNNFNPSLPTSQPFSNVQSSHYWSATTKAHYTGGSTSAWRVDMAGGEVSGNSKSGAHYVWPVRSGGSSANSVVLTVTKAGSGAGTVNASPGILTWNGNTGSRAYLFGTSVTLTASANSGGAFTGWSGAGCSGTGTCAVTMNTAKSVTATFDVITPTYTLTVTKTGTGSGSVTASSGILNWSGNTGAGTYNSGTSVTLTASANSGGAFTGWSGGGCSGTGACVVTMSAAQTVTATFNPIPTDSTPPLVSITSPPNGATKNKVYAISGAASDADSGVAFVQVQITDGIWYVDSSQGMTQTSTWVTATGTTSWSFNTSQVNWTDGDTYTIRAKSMDVAGNVSTTATGTFTYSLGGGPTQGLGYTTLSINLTSQTILQNGTIDATGKLTRLPDDGTNLSGLAVKLIITAPDRSTVTLTGATYDSYGHFKFLNLGAGFQGFSGFTQKGPYTLQATFDATSNPLLANSNSTARTALVGASAGYAIIVVGKLPNGQGIQSHNKTAHRVYKTLKKRGFIDPNIYYFNYNTSQAGVDAAPTKAGIQTAITSWALGKMNGAPAPLYIIFHDHGNKNTFYMDNDTITPSDLDSWLFTLENGLSPNASREKRIIIYGACYSGSFIPGLSKPDRLIITSAAANEQSYKGAMEPDGVRSGSYFLEELFKELERGYSLKASFVKATEKTETFTRKGGPSANTNSPYFDGAAQHPHLDDNADKVGSNILSVGVGDGQAANNQYLGSGVTYSVNSANNPADILNTTNTVYLGSSASSALLWAKANDDSQVGSAWMEIRPPSMTLTVAGGTNQAPVNLINKAMALNTSASRWEGTYSSFTAPGMYEVFYFVNDAQTLDISPAQRSVVYKNKAGNNPPTGFSLVSPANGAQQNTVVVFEWAPSSDPDGVTYNLAIATDPAFGNVVHREEGISATTAYVDSNAGLKDLTTYYWGVQAVDGYGAVTNSSQAWTFKTDNTNSFPGIIFGRILKASDNSPIIGATITTDLGAKTKSLTGGAYILKVPSATNITLTASQGGYSNTSVGGITVSPGAQTTVNMPMAAMIAPTPDIKANGSNGPITITQADTLSITVSLGPGNTTGTADWWLLAVDSSNQTFYFDMSANSFKLGNKVTYQGALGTLPSTPVLNTKGIPRGSYTFYFGVDMAPDGILTLNPGQFFYNSVVVNVTQ